MRQHTATGPGPEAAGAYVRLHIGWVKRRARRLMSAYDISRRLAVFEATIDYTEFVRSTDKQPARGSASGGRPFAPGVIEHYAPPQGLARHLCTLGLAALALAALAAVLGFLSGYFKPF